MTALVQLGRYAVAGFVITSAVAASYWAIAEFGGIDPMVSLTLVYIVFSGVSYFTHGAFSFKGHGTRGQHPIRLSRFVMVSLAGFAINQTWVWLLVKQMGGPTWWPTVPIILVTPVIIFALLRRYVYF